MRHAFVIMIAIVGLLASGTPAFTQQEEVLVTGSLIREAIEAPHVTLVRRADNLISDVRVVCDTRDSTLRQQELRETLRNMVRAAAADQAIELGLMGNEVVGEFNETMLDAVIRLDTRPDTSVAVLTVKTAVGAMDTFDRATQRIEAFIERTPKVGRVEILRAAAWNLTLIDPERSRPQILQLVAADAQRTAAVFGPQYGFTIQGLQLPVAWHRAGPLDLALYVPYELHVLPQR